MDIMQLVQKLPARVKLEVHPRRLITSPTLPLPVVQSVMLKFQLPEEQKRLPAAMEHIPIHSHQAEAHQQHHHQPMAQVL
jgi:hypothetical protein